MMMDVLWDCIERNEEVQFVKKEPCEEDTYGGTVPIDDTPWWMETSPVLVMEPLVTTYSQDMIMMTATTTMPLAPNVKGSPKPPISSSSHEEEDSEITECTENTEDADSCSSMQESHVLQSPKSAKTPKVPGEPVRESMFEDKVNQVIHDCRGLSPMTMFRQILVSFSTRDVWKFTSLEHYERFVEFILEKIGKKGFDFMKYAGTETIQRHKEIRRRISNRISARESRKRKAEERKQLIEDTKRLRRENTSLKLELRRLREELVDVKGDMYVLSKSLGFPKE
jgi:hypothetical protein